MLLTLKEQSAEIKYLGEYASIYPIAIFWKYENGGLSNFERCDWISLRKRKISWTIFAKVESSNKQTNGRKSRYENSVSQDMSVPLSLSIIYREKC